MPSTFFGLTIGKSGIYTANAGINTTAHNIANTETEGYCRQLVKQSASVPIKVNSTYGMAGTGSNVNGIEQVRDEYFDLKYWSNNTLAGNYSTKAYYMTEIENYFNEIKLEGFTTTFNSFYDSLQELSKNPADLTIRTQVTSFGQTFCEYFSYISESMEKIQKECNFEIESQVSRINSIGEQIAVLSKQINKLEVSGVMANDLRDKRALLVDDLSSIVKVSVTEKIVGEGIGVNSYVVKIGNQVLVNDYDSFKIKLVPRTEKINQSDVDGLYDLRWDNGAKFDIERPNLKGTLQALFDVRDGNNGEAFKGTALANPGDSVIRMTSTNYNDINKMNIDTSSVIRIGNSEYKYTGFQVTQDEDTGEYIYEFSIDVNKTPISGFIMDEPAIIGRDIPYKGIPYYLSQMNEFVRTFSKAFNEIHKSGEDLNGEEGLDFFNGKHVVTGENYVFETSQDDIDNNVLFTSKTGEYTVENEDKNYGSYYFMTVKNFCVTNKLYYNADMVAAASSITNGVENADNINKILELKNDHMMFRQGTASAFLETLVSEIGIDTSKCKQFAQNQEDILMSVTNQRLSVSGVDSDEEAMNLIRYQNAYNLSAKVISVMNEIYDKLINYMGA